MRCFREFLSRFEIVARRTREYLLALINRGVIEGMDNVVTFRNDPGEAGHWVVVAVGRSGASQQHIGIMHRSHDSSFYFLHLAWHCKLCQDAKQPDYLSVWVAPNVPPKRQRAIAAFCRRVWRKNARHGIPYAFSSPQGSFDPATGAYLIRPSRYGLTCASFVLALFHAAGLPLADYDSWPSGRPGDAEWQREIIELLEQQQTDRQHIDHLRSEIGAVRFRPEEVAASTGLAPPAADFQRAEPLGQLINDRIRKNNQPA